MRGVVLAGGSGSRLEPLTRGGNKHLLAVGDRPMISYPLECLVRAGIDQVLLVTGEEHAADFRALLGDGRGLGLARLEYASQRGDGGIADALRLAEDFAAGGRVCAVLGDNIIGGSVRGAAERFAAQICGARVFLKEVPDARGFGVARLDGGRLVEIVEKPEKPPSRLAVVGIYFYDGDVFNICRDLAPSARGELEITDVNNAYLARGELAHELLEGWWADAGTPEGLERATRLAAERGANRADA